MNVKRPYAFCHSSFSLHPSSFKLAERVGFETTVEFPPPAFEIGFATPPTYDELGYSNKHHHAQSSKHSLSVQVSSRHCIDAPSGPTQDYVATVCCATE